MMGSSGAPTPGEADAVFQLLAVISDPKASQKRLAELTAEREKMQAATAEARDARAEAQASATAAKQLSERAQADRLEADTHAARVLGELRERESALLEREQTVSALAAQNEARAVDLTQRESESTEHVTARTAELNARATALIATEAKAAEALKQGEALREEFQGKMDRLAALAR